MDQQAFGRANECLLEDDWFSESSIPELLEDETVYSWCARFHRLNGGYDPRVTSRVLFGHPKAGLRHDIPGHMGAFQIKTRDATPIQGGRRKKDKTKNPRKKAPAALIGILIWMDRDYLERLESEKLLITVEIEREPIYFIPIGSQKDKKIFSKRCAAMANFLDLIKMKEKILVHGGLGGLVRETMKKAKVSRTFVYRQWSILCKLGISQISLLPRHDRCGAPKVSRPCDPEGRQKAGRKTRACHQSNSLMR